MRRLSFLKLSKLNNRMLEIYVSDVAAAIGKNRFKTPENVLYEMWKKKQPYSFRQLCVEHGFVEKNFVRVKMMNNANTIQTYYNEHKSSTAKDMAAKLAPLLVVETSSSTMPAMSLTDIDQLMIAKTIDVDVSTVGTVGKNNLDIIEKEITTMLQTKNGILEESNILNACEENTDTKITERNQTTFSLPCTTFVLKGRVDGIDRENDLLYEVKTRQNRLFNMVPEYERIPILIYLEMTGLSKARHVEKYKTAEKATIIERNHDKEWFMQNIIIPLEKFTVSAHEFFHSTEKQLAALKKFCVSSTTS